MEKIYREVRCVWNTVQCAVQGKGHVKTGTPCQDRTYHVKQNNVDVIALADGAGSANMSHYGAKFVTMKICQLLSEQFEMYYNEEDGAAVKRVIIGILLEGLEQLSNKFNCDIKDMASTLLVVAIHDGKYIILHIGDGVIGYVKNDELKVASHPENGEFVNTTIFVTSKDALATMKLMKGQLNGITGFTLMSDGTETSLYDKKEKKLAPVLKKMMDLLKLMDSDCLQLEIEKSFEKVIKNSTSDDCSIILFVEEDLDFDGYRKLTSEQKRKMLGIRADSNYKNRIKRYDEILEYTTTARNMIQISKRFFLKKKYCQRHIELLLERNLLISYNGFLYTAVIMEK